MKRQKYFIFSILWILSFNGFLSCDTANNVENPDLHYFVKYYGGDGNQQAVDMVALSDGSFLLLGNYLESAFDSDIYLLRVDAKGEVIWEKRFADASAKDIEPTNDGNFALLADEIGAQIDVRLYKISSDGDKLDSLVFGDPVKNDYSRTVTPLDDGGFLVSGTTEATEIISTTDPGDTFTYRFDQNLDKDPAWLPDVKGFRDLQSNRSLLDVAVKTVPAPDGFYVIGYTNSNLSNTNPNAKFGLFYFRRDSSGGEGLNMYPGNIENFNDTEISFVQQVAPQLGTGHIVVGTSQSNFGVSQIFIARLRQSLVFQDPLLNDITLHEIIPIGRNIRGVAATSAVVGAAGFIVVGNEVRTLGTSNIWVSKVDQIGEPQWSSTFGSETEDDTAAAVAELPDGKIVILGTMGLADNQSKMAFIKVNPRGQLLK